MNLLINQSISVLTASQVGDGAAGGRYPQVGRSGVEDDLEVLGGFAQRDLAEVLGLPNRQQRYIYIYFLRFYFTIYILEVGEVFHGADLSVASTQKLRRVADTCQRLTSTRVLVQSDSN